METRKLLMAALASALILPASAAWAYTGYSRPDFPKELGTINQQAVKSVHFRVAPPYSEPLLEPLSAPETISIKGPAYATQAQMVAFIKRNNPHPKLNCSVEELVGYYYEEAGREGIRPDIVLCQAIKETGFFGYGGDVIPEQNNYCGLGTTGGGGQLAHSLPAAVSGGIKPRYSRQTVLSRLGTTGGGVKGAFFETPQLGVRAHVQHLLVYDRTEPPSTDIIDPRYKLVIEAHPEIYGQIHNWTDLNGRWAVPGKNYGQDILQLWQTARTPDASDAALSAVEIQLQQAKNDANSYIARGIAYAKRGNIEKAKADYEQALRMNKNSLAARYNLALLQESQGDSKSALKNYKKLNKEHPYFPQAWFNKGCIELANGNSKEAMEDFQNVTELATRQVYAMNNIALAQLQQKKYAEAWATLVEAGQVNTENLYVLANQFILEACQK